MPRRWLVNDEVSFTVNSSWSNPKGGLARHSCYVLCHWALGGFDGGRGDGPSRLFIDCCRSFGAGAYITFPFSPSLPFLPAQTFLISPLLLAAPLLFALRRRRGSFSNRISFDVDDRLVKRVACNLSFDSEEKLAVRRNRGCHRYLLNNWWK